MVTDPFGAATGIDQNGILDLNIPNSFYLDSDTNPAVIIANPDNGLYPVDVIGRRMGEYNLSIATIDIVNEIIAQLTAAGDIATGDSIRYEFDLASMEGIITEAFTSAPEPSTLVILIAALLGLSVMRVKLVSAAL